MRPRRRCTPRSRSTVLVASGSGTTHYVRPLMAFFVITACARRVNSWMLGVCPMTDTPRFEIWPVLEHYGWELPAPRGTWQSIKCGAHEDSHASCRVSSDEGYVKCLACDFHGDAIDVVRHYEGIGFRAAVSRCEELTGGSDTGVSRPNRGSRSVPSRSRYQSRNRQYVPPRLRRNVE